MSTVEYERLGPNIGQVRVDGSAVHVSWKCPATGRLVGESTASMLADGSVTGRVRASVKRSIASEIIYGGARFLSGVLGGAVGRVLNNAVYTAAADINTKATQGVDYTEDSRRAAIVAAFDSVKDSFVWDESSQRFVAR
jgi:hypothetical protein